MQELEKILKEIKEMLEDNKVIELNSDGTIDKCVIDAKLAWDYIKDIIRKHMNDGWISVETPPKNEQEVLVILRTTYPSNYWMYSTAKYIRVENEYHWCDNHYGYLEWNKYSDNSGGCSQYKVVKWQPIEPYLMERNEGE